MVYDPFLILGIIGMICILVGFLLTQRHIWTQDQTRYDIVNFVGSALLLIYALEGRAWPFVILNGVWALYSLKDVIADLGKSRK
ncbi:MAG TPA: hypothetical protein VJB82_02860 [Candidatus Peribacterales bacterium]|nr:hypothetical protein [Candidatus Peribacterales bacterium]